MLAQIKQSYFALVRQQIKHPDTESILRMLLHPMLDCEQKPIPRLCDAWGQSSWGTVSRKLSISLFIFIL